MLDALSHADFTPQLNTKFRLLPPSAPALELELIQADEYTSAPHQERFSLIFLGPLGAPIEQGIYPLEHDQLGAGDIFLVPISRDEKGFCYEAAFNRFRQKTEQ